MKAEFAFAIVVRIAAIRRFRALCLHFSAHKNVQIPHFSAPKSVIELIITAELQRFVKKLACLEYKIALMMPWQVEQELSDASFRT